MTDTAKIPVVWDGLAGLPGLSIFHSTTAQAPTLVSALVTFFTAIKGQFPTGLTWQIPSSGDTFDDQTGTLTGTWTGGSGSTVAASGGSTVYAAGTGAYVRWDTGAVINGRRVKGRTFLCPILGATFDTNGTLQNATVAAWQTAVNTLVSSSTLRVWHRPPPGGNTGIAVLVTAGTVPDKVTSLRSRRS